ncbi:DMT family transporter [Halogeometricum borinquense]|uniref:DMT family transporter n=1 Tax=Halogeometricum borinquense TaxID=60847 RepID=A0A6C0UJA2_9EURY|nr:DMT family transporter [Halogeometricum borinquense]QIB75614.1 DMT family transporter [Halogeometricum borinquense]
MVATPRKQFRVPAGLAIVGLGSLWGAGFPAIDIVVEQLPPLGAAGIRYAVSGCIVLAYAAATTDRLLPKTWRELLGIAVIGGFMFGGYQAGLYMGTTYVSGAVASVVTTMSPVVAAVVAVPILGESRGILDIIGFFVGIAGVFVLSQPSVGTASVSSTAIGVGLVFLGTTLFAIGSVTIQLFDEELPAESLQGWAMVVGAGLLFCGAAARGEAVPALRSLSPLALGSLLYITLIAGAGGYLLYFRLVRRVGATETTLVAYLEPLSATFVTVVFFDQTLDETTVIGFLAVAAGFTLVSRETMRHAVTRLRESDTSEVRPSRNHGD